MTAKLKCFDVWSAAVLLRTIMCETTTHTHRHTYTHTQTHTNRIYLSEPKTSTADSDPMGQVLCPVYAFIHPIITAMLLYTTYAHIMLMINCGADSYL